MRIEKVTFDDPTRFDQKALTSFLRNSGKAAEMKIHKCFCDLCKQKPDYDVAHYWADWLMPPHTLHGYSSPGRKEA